MEQNKEIKEYFNILCKGDYPTFIDKYINTKEMQRLSGIGQFCGCDYTSIHNIKYWFSRLDHSIATALMTWNFTKDKTQTLAALFHDLGTPAFSHCIDYLMGDTINQESSEINVYDVINNSTTIKGYLKNDNINIEDIKDISIYPVVENKKPKICVDRLDGILGTCLVWQQYWDLSTVKKVYDDMVVLTNEYGEDEIGFQNKDIAELFFEGVFKYSIELQKNEDKYTMQFIADILKDMLKNNRLKLEDLYIFSEEYIISMVKTIYNDYNVFSETKMIERTDEIPENNYYVSIDAKKRYVVPICVDGNKIARLDTFSNKCKEKLEEYLNFKDSKYAYVKKIGKR